MRDLSRHKQLAVALLTMGSAISLMACGSEPTVTEPDDEKIVSRVVRNMEWLSLENGRKDRLMRAPLREEHAFARPAFETFPEGVEVIGYDSLGQPSSRVVADYALHWTERDLWELNGNVVVEGEEGQKLYTQQLRWDRKIKKVYSNVDSKLEENGMPLYGVGFEAADDFSNWVFRGVTGTVPVEVKPTSDSTKVNSPEQSAGDPPEEIVKKVENTPKPAVPAPRRERPAKSLRREGDALRPMNVEPIKR